MNIDERRFKSLIDLYGVNSIIAACRNYATTGSIKLNKIDEISDDMIDEVIDALYNIDSDFDYDGIKDRRDQGNQFVTIVISYGNNINFKITPEGEYSLVYFTGIGKAVSKDSDFKKCLNKFITKFRHILPRID